MTIQSDTTEQSKKEKPPLYPSSILIPTTLSQE